MQYEKTMIAMRNKYRRTMLQTEDPNENQQNDGVTL